LIIAAMALTACGGNTANNNGNMEDNHSNSANNTSDNANTSADDTAAEDMEPVTLTVLIHQHPPLVEYMEAFNARFEEAYPYVTVDMSVVNAGELATVAQTRLTAGDIDILDLAGFANGAQPYMVDVVPPNWQTLIEAGLLMDLSGQDFVANYNEGTIANGTFDGGVYQLGAGTTIYSGVFYNKAMFADRSLSVPTTWDELVAICDTFAAEDISCMTAGGADGWPVFVGAYGLIGSIYPDQAALVEGLWNGDITWDNETSLEMWTKMQVYASEFLEEGVTGITHDGAPGRFAAGAVPMLPMGNWNASMIEGVDADLDWGYFPFPGSDDAANNQTWFGKLDMGWSIAGNTANEAEAIAYLAMLSDPAEYQTFVDVVQFIPTQSTAVLNSRLGNELAKFSDFRIGYEQLWVAPTGTGQYAAPWASWFQPFNEFDDPAVLAAQAQADLDAGLATVFGD
jgi:raffinose/stachyose/melibiose transport system substrate-binding protein